MEDEPAYTLKQVCDGIDPAIVAEWAEVAVWHASRSPIIRHSLETVATIAEEDPMVAEDVREGLVKFVVKRMSVPEERVEEVFSNSLELEELDDGEA